MSEQISLHLTLLQTSSNTLLQVALVRVPLTLPTTEWASFDPWRMPLLNDHRLPRANSQMLVDQVAGCVCICPSQTLFAVSSSVLYYVSNASRLQIVSIDDQRHLPLPKCINTTVDAEFMALRYARDLSSRPHLILREHSTQNIIDFEPESGDCITLLKEGIVKSTYCAY